MGWSAAVSGLDIYLYTTYLYTPHSAGHRILNRCNITRWGGQQPCPSPPQLQSLSRPSRHGDHWTTDLVQFLLYCTFTIWLAATISGGWDRLWFTELQCFIDIYSLGGGTCPPVSYFYYKYQKSMNVTMQCVDRWILWIATSKPTGCSVWRRRKYLATFDHFPEDSEKPLNPASVLGCELACVGTAGSGTKQD